MKGAGNNEVPAGCTEGRRKGPSYKLRKSPPSIGGLGRAWRGRLGCSSQTAGAYQHQCCGRAGGEGPTNSAEAQSICHNLTLRPERPNDGRRGGERAHATAARRQQVPITRPGVRCQSCALSESNRQPRTGQVRSLRPQGALGGMGFAPVLSLYEAWGLPLSSRCMLLHSHNSSD